MHNDDKHEIFISYSSKDKEIVNLLAYILNEYFICLYDQKITDSKPFREEITQMIDRSEIMLIILTEHSSVSLWVNQEIGYAKAKGKIILPIEFKDNIKPEGMINDLQSYQKLDWNNIKQSLENLVNIIKTLIERANNDPIDPIADYALYANAKLDQILTGVKIRTQFLNNRLQELDKIKDTHIDIYYLSSYSAFSISTDPRFRSFRDDDEYLKLLLKEKELKNKIFTKENVNVYMLLHPSITEYSKDYLIIRFLALLEWLKSVRDNTQINYKCIPNHEYKFRNKFIVKNFYSVEGHKTRKEPGLDLSIVLYHNQKINEAIEDFNYYYNAFKQSKEEAIQEMESLYNKCKL